MFSAIAKILLALSNLFSGFEAARTSHKDNNGDSPAEEKPLIRRRKAAVQPTKPVDESVDDTMSAVGGVLSEVNAGVQIASSVTSALVDATKNTEGLSGTKIGKGVEKIGDFLHRVDDGVKYAAEVGQRFQAAVDAIQPAVIKESEPTDAAATENALTPVSDVVREVSDVDGIKGTKADRKLDKAGAVIDKLGRKMDRAIELTQRVGEAVADAVDKKSWERTHPVIDVPEEADDPTPPRKGGGFFGALRGIWRKKDGSK
jgi:hypothetical protein